MNPSETNENPEPDKTPRIGRREIGAFLLLLAINCDARPRSSSGAARQRVTIPYSPTFLAQVQAGNVSTVTAQDTAIQGTLKHAIRYPARDKNVQGDDRVLDPGAGLRGHEGARHAAAGEGRRDHGEGAARDAVLADAARRLPPDDPVLRALVLDHAAVGQRQHVRLRKLEGEEVRADDGAGHLRRRRRDRRGQGGARRGRRLPPRPGQVPQARRAHPARRPADRGAQVRARRCSRGQSPAKRASRSSRCRRRSSSR